VDAPMGGGFADAGRPAERHSIDELIESKARPAPPTLRPRPGGRRKAAFAIGAATDAARWGLCWCQALSAWTCSSPASRAMPAIWWSCVASSNGTTTAD